MNFHNGEYYVEVKDHRYRIHPTEIIVLRKQDPPHSLRTQYQVQNEIQISRNLKVVEKNGKIEVKNYPKKKKQLIKQQPKFKPPNCPSCKRNIWLQVDKGYYCKICEYIINKQKHQVCNKILRQDHYFSTRLPYANKKNREIYHSMANTTYNSSEDTI